ncbi:mucin-5AC [Thrips palmi]|uniref:Mucin-5AC n=1 Tax=Thrips palmi TaxID=161013 RepID=A0A6P8ZT76_THRPL|nr:mucin-5AC [Thrips palmi]
MMRELDTVSPVVWPAWCYSGGQPESESSGVASADVLQARPQLVPPSASSMASSSSSSLRPSAAALGGGASAHRKRRSVPRSYDSPTTALNGARSSVKSERLSPSGSVHGLHDSASTSSLSRSGTPSSPPASSIGHPAGASPAASPSRSTSNNNTTTLNNNNISSHLKAMEDSVTHNYSEFMRNLAAKYQYVHPDEFYSATRNGFPAALDPRFPYKAGAATFLMPPLGPLPGVGVPGVPPGVVSPLHHLAAPVSAPPPPAPKDSAPATSSRSSGGSSRSAASDRDRDRDRDREDRDPAATNHSDDRAAAHKPTAKSPPSSAASVTSAVSDSATSLLFSPLFSGGLPGTLPGALPGSVPVMDMSSTQALVNMVQRSHQNQLETYLKGAIKRPAETSPSPLSPLDLSSAAAPPKKSRKREGGDLYGVDALLGLPSSLIRSSKERLATRTPPSRALSSPRLAAAPAPASPGQAKGGNPLSCSALCSTSPGHATAEGPCTTDAGAASILHWSVGDVCNFVGSIDLCVEYVQAFRDQRIDGSALPLLTEEHLRTQMKMRLGPALKLRAVLAKRLGHCSVCLHCVHCHNLPPSSTASSATGTTTTSTTTTATPGSPQSASGTVASTSTSPSAAGSPPPARPSSAAGVAMSLTTSSERSATASPKPTPLVMAPRPSSVGN